MPPDPNDALITEADAHLAAGMAELKEGHLNGARAEFDKAVDVYLTAPGGAYGHPRRAEAYRRTLEAIHLRELEALAAGDGFTEKPAEPAAIDEVAELAVEETPPSEETRRTTEDVVQEEVSDFPVVLNDKVLTCVDLYQGRLREWFGEALDRGAPYLPKIREIFASEGIPTDLAYVALVESAFKTGALSRAKARGVWQFMPATGRHYGLQQDWWVDERSDPEKATRAAARYLKTLYQMFGDWNLALAGYNAGEGVVYRGLNRYRVRDFWALARTRGLRRETKNYVPLIHAAIVVAKAPEKYGFQVTPAAASTVDMVPVDGAVDLRVISECAGTALVDVQSLNPELRRLATPANKTFQVRVPEGKGGLLQDCLKALPAEKRVQFRSHVVARGQTLSTIATRYGARTRDIADANGFALTKRLRVGTELIIPIPVDPRAAVRRTAQETKPPAGAEVSAREPQQARITYRIKPGDTLAGIASQYGTTVQNLLSWNRLRTTRIAAGEVLTIYTKH
jgi:membrane-bound lytic murein transglycosylase D